jgi:hypothetical protein
MTDVEARSELLPERRSFVVPFYFHRAIGPSGHRAIGLLSALSG